MDGKNLMTYENAVHAAAQLGRLDFVSALLAMVALIFAISTVFNVISLN
jgi:hypothetical protein